MNFTFRASKEADHARIHAVWAASVRATHDFLSEADFSEISDLVRDVYVPNAEFLVAEQEGQVVGFMGMTDLKIDSLFIAPSVFGQGLGRALVEQARKVGRPLLVDVNEQNSGAVAFYQRLGFKQVGRTETDDAGRPYPILEMSE